MVSHATPADLKYTLQEGNKAYCFTSVGVDDEPICLPCQLIPDTPFLGPQYRCDLPTLPTFSFMLCDQADPPACVPCNQPPGEDSTCSPCANSVAIDSVQSYLPYASKDSDDTCSQKCRPVQGPDFRPVTRRALPDLALMKQGIEYIQCDSEEDAKGTVWWILGKQQFPKQVPPPRDIGCLDKVDQDLYEILLRVYGAKALNTYFGVEKGWALPRDQILSVPIYAIAKLLPCEEDFFEYLNERRQFDQKLCVWLSNPVLGQKQLAFLEPVVFEDKHDLVQTLGICLMTVQAPTYVPSVQAFSAANCRDQCVGLCARMFSKKPKMKIYNTKRFCDKQKLCMCFQ